MYPSAPPTVNDVVRDGRDFGRRLRIGRSTICTTGSAGGPGAPAPTGLSGPLGLGAGRGRASLDGLVGALGLGVGQRLTHLAVVAVDRGRLQPELPGLQVDILDLLDRGR